MSTNAKINIFKIILLGLILTCLISCETTFEKQVPTESIANTAIVDSIGDLFTENIKANFKVEHIEDPVWPDDTIFLENPYAKDHVAATYCMESCEIVVFQEGNTRTRKLNSTSFSPGRPFSNLQWLSDEVLAFKQWSQPHHGLYYEVNITTEELIKVIPIND